MQAVGNSGALSRLVRFPATLVAAQRVLTGADGGRSCIASYHGHIRNPVPLGLALEKVQLWADARCSPLNPHTNPALNHAFFSTFSGKTSRKKSFAPGGVRAAVSSRPKPSSRPSSKPSSKPNFKPAGQAGPRPNPRDKDDALTPKREPAPWLIAREDVKRQASSDKKARKQEAEVDIFGVPLGERGPREDGMKVGDYEPHALKLRSAEFIISSTDVSKCPDTDKPEFAVVGRSNVGKSSLINMVTNRKSLAMTSKKPGKTQTINHFLINDDWYLVDLPGYGYAAAPGKARSAWNEFTKDYFLNRKQLVTVLLLIDASIAPQEIDLECAEWLGENQVPVSLVFTKCDKRKKTKAGGKHPTENIADFESMLKETWDELPPKILTSSVTGTGRHELLSHLSQLRSFWKDRD
ncbi:GTP-binding protein [Klebsormidium nitens]|uniref:GTP-binding protein n=1 Tax=Klebsormidium nitens TaxID=105231 RepID=A0A1Y1I9V1_KLENI|nr:GTP-binding protein [Klebsormidium nitens]|eukprot:GAQ86732.1 GTP-binding protein [Klebsormidium nitens]